jgi:carboxymethylenebutenolidase
MGRGWYGLLAVACIVVSACGSGDTPDPDQEFLQRTAEEHAEDSPEPSPVASVEPDEAVVGRMLAYGEGRDRNLMGYLAMPADALEPKPGLIVIHEWWGLNDNIQAAADRLAGEGYIALAIDLYEGRTATSPAEAQTLMGALMADQEPAKANIRQAYEYLKKYALSPKVGVIGWCLGGGWSLQSAVLLGHEVDAAVMFYGQVSNDAEALAGLQAPLLGLFAGQDRSIALKDVESFRETLEGLDKDVTIHIYPGADHAFANPSGGNYNEVAAEDAWERTLDFLRSRMGGGA